MGKNDNVTRYPKEKNMLRDRLEKLHNRTHYKSRSPAWHAD